jgi:hypothetical protein
MERTGNKNLKQTEEEIRDQIKALSKKADELSGQQLNLLSNIEIGDEDIDSAFDLSKLDQSANPTESHRLYYGMMGMLKNNLPKGLENKKLRQFIYDEKNLFLNRGEQIKEDGRRGSDGRMTYIHDFLTDAYAAVSSWVLNGANSYDIYLAFRKMNEEKGYHNNNN